MKTFANETEKIEKEGRQHWPLRNTITGTCIRETRRGREIGIPGIGERKKEKKKILVRGFQEKKT